MLLCHVQPHGPSYVVDRKRPTPMLAAPWSGLVSPGIPLMSCASCASLSGALVATSSSAMIVVSIVVVQLWAMFLQWLQRAEE